MKQELVRDWMTTRVISAPPEMTLPEAHRLMAQHKVRRLPVVEDGRLVGIVTLGDVRGAAASDATSLHQWEMDELLGRVTLRKIMTTNPVTIRPDDTIGEAASVMLSEKVSGLPVVNGRGGLAGIITESDIFRLVVRAWDEG